MDGKKNGSLRSRRRFLTLTGGIAVSPALTGYLRYRSDRSFADTDRDGLPDELKRSSTFHHILTRLYGNQFEGLQVGRRDFLLDVRYVGGITVPVRVKRYLEATFRRNGIHLQWLDYPERYDRERFDDQYGNNARQIIWSRDSFYHNEIEDELKDVAFQLVMVPGAPAGPNRGRIYSPWARVAGNRQYINGMNFGNRAVAAKRYNPWEQTRLIFHEIAHLALCHDYDPSNTGVMGTNETLTLTDEEWETLRENLSNVRDTTGFDQLIRRCLWFDDPGGTGAWRGCGKCRG